jgi:CheY-like chemotaxis protein
MDGLTAQHNLFEWSFPGMHRLLVIDDDIEVGTLIAETAQACGIACIVTTNADDFFQSLAASPTMIFLDLLMPGVDGIEIMRKLASRKCEAGIIMMSGVGKRVIESAETLGRSLGLTIVGHLSKPFRIAELELLLASQAGPKPNPLPSKTRQVIVEEADLLRAIEQDEFVLHYQPQIDFATGLVVGVEALVRWQHPRHGLVFPDNFIYIAEELGLIDQLTRLVLQHGLSEIGLFHAEGRTGSSIALSVNVSVSSFYDLEFPNRLERQLLEHRPRSLTHARRPHPAASQRLSVIN